MCRGVCMTRAPVVRVCGGWGGTHLRYLAVKSAVRTGSYHAAARFLIDADGVGGGGLQESVHRRMADLGGRPSTPAAPSVLRAAPHNHTRGGSPHPWSIPPPAPGRCYIDVALRAARTSGAGEGAGKALRAFSGCPSLSEAPTS